jgi:SAM-dependent methyltransferase
MSHRFTHEPLSEVIAYLRAQLQATSSVTITVPNPDLTHGHYPGELERIPQPRHAVSLGLGPAGGVAKTPGARRHRPLRVWTDLADRLELRLRTPMPSGDTLALTFEALDRNASLLPRGTRGPGKYAPGSGFERASKLEEPDFLLDLDDALERCALPASPRILSLGVNTGDEFVPILGRHPDALCTGIDHDAQALDVARARFGDPHRFLQADLARLPDLPRHDLLVCIDTLQSPGVDDRAVLRHAVQHLLHPHGCLILGIPNCRYVDGELLHGARMVNFRQPELSLLLKGVAFYKKYLQQHRKRVFVTGKHEILVTAIPIQR